MTPAGTPTTEAGASPGVGPSQAIVDSLEQRGVATVFGLMGDGNLRFLVELIERGTIRYVAGRHECGVIAMADGFSRVSGRTGVASVTQGPGLTNALTALVEARKASSPIVLLAGDTPRLAKRHNQDIDQSAVLKSLEIRTRTVRGVETLGEDILDALDTASRARTPVVVSIPTDIQVGLTAQSDRAEVPVAARTQPTDEALGRVAELALRAKAPLILAGHGAVDSEAGVKLRQLAERIGALLSTTAAGHGLFAGDPWDAGIAGGFTSPQVAQLMRESDLVLVFGASLNEWTTRHGGLFGDSATIVANDLRAEALGAFHRIDIGIVGDVRSTVERLLELIGPAATAVIGHRTGDAQGVLEEDREARLHPIGTGGSGLDPRQVLAAIDAKLPLERTVVTDSGHFLGFPARHLRVPDERGWVFAQAFQSVGLGLGNVIGAAIARPDRLPVLVIGDGGLLMSLGELETLIRLQLRALVVVLNDAAYGAEIHTLEVLGMRPEHAFFDDTNFASIATGLGARGATVNYLSDLAVIDQWVDGPPSVLLLDCKIDRAVRAEWFDEAFGPGSWFHPENVEPVEASR